MNEVRERLGGTIDSVKGTTDNDLNNLAKKLNIKNYRGCFMRDELKNLTPLSQESGILNFQSSSEGNGTHWTAWFKNNNTERQSTEGQSKNIKIFLKVNRDSKREQE